MAESYTFMLLSEHFFSSLSLTYIVKDEINRIELWKILILVLTSVYWRAKNKANNNGDNSLRGDLVKGRYWNILRIQIFPMNNVWYYVTAWFFWFFSEKTENRKKIILTIQKKEAVSKAYFLVWCFCRELNPFFLLFLAGDFFFF